MSKKKKRVLIISLFVVLLAGALVFAYYGGQKSAIGEVTPKKNDEMAIKEVIIAFYKQAKNFTWEAFDSEKGLEFWTTEGRERYLENDVPSFRELMISQKISVKLLGIRFEEIMFEENTAQVSLIAQEEFTCEEPTGGLDGIVQEMGAIELEKNGSIWQIQNYNFHFVRIGE